MSMIKTYHVSAPYFLNGHHNVDGLAIADDFNKKLNDADQTTELSAYENELSTVDATLYGLTIETIQTEIDA